MIDIQYSITIIGGREVSKALKNYKIVDEVKIFWRLVTVGNG